MKETTMRIFRSLFALACLIAGTALGLASAMMSHALPRHGRSHAHLMQHAPRSIIDTRRMGLA